ncbi:MAG: hypothetical protein ACPH4D_04600 [Porticoccaceae bacterium]
MLAGLGGIDRRALGIPSEEDYVALYCQRMGLLVKPLAKMAVELID